ncbi:MAG TPA: DUF4148 domain-containing protein [Noviherbaspirillum sp.]|nr:DUF4148 domain-containing protein [Noviherbaspirillum sp.]
MKAKQLMAAVAMLAATGVAFAGDSTEYVDFGKVKSAKTRAEVRAELQQAYAEGKVGQYSEFVEYTQVASSKTRDEVRKEAVQEAKGKQNRVPSFGG